jgi:hypothetical protein
MSGVQRPRAAAAAAAVPPGVAGAAALQRMCVSPATRARLTDNSRNSRETAKAKATAEAARLAERNAARKRQRLDAAAAAPLAAPQNAAGATGAAAAPAAAAPAAARALQAPGAAEDGGVAPVLRRGSGGAGGLREEDAARARETRTCLGRERSACADSCCSPTPASSASWSAATTVLHSLSPVPLLGA